MVIFLVLVFLWIFALVDIFTTAGFQITTFLLSVFMTIITLMQFGLFMLSFRTKSFRWADGTNGVIIKGPEILDEDRVCYWVSVFKEFAPQEEIKNKEGGLSSFFDMVCLTTTVTVKVIDRPDLFLEIPHQSCNDPNGCVLYHGSISGLPLFDDVEELKTKLLHNRDKVVKYQTMMREIQNQANLMAQSTNKDIAESAQLIYSIVKGIDKRNDYETPVNNNTKK